MDGKTPEQFVGRENDKIGGGKTKPAAQCSFEQVDVSQCVGRNDLAKTLDLTLGLEIDCNGCVFVAPLLQPRDELGALRFREHELADGELADGAFDERTGEILRCRFIVSDPGLANLDMKWSGKIRRARCRRSSALLFRLELDHEG